MIKVMVLPWVQCIILWNIIPIHVLSEKLCLGQYQKPLCVSWSLTSDLGSRSWHFLWAIVTTLWNIIPIHAFNENLWPGQCLIHYEHSDLDLWQITLDQGQNTSLGPGQQSFEILFKFIERIRSYGLDKLFASVLTIMCIVTLTFDQWPWIKVVTLPSVQCKILWNII
jgi:hypothetical protein